MPAELLEQVRVAFAARKQANVLRQKARIAMHRSVHTLTACGLSYRDTGDYLGISHQRVAQYMSMESAAAAALVGLERKGT